LLTDWAQIPSWYHFLKNNLGSIRVSWPLKTVKIKSFKNGWQYFEAESSFFCIHSHFKIKKT